MKMFKVAKSDFRDFPEVGFSTSGLFRKGKER